MSSSPRFFLIGTAVLALILCYCLPVSSSCCSSSSSSSSRLLASSRSWHANNKQWQAHIAHANNMHRKGRNTPRGMSAGCNIVVLTSSVEVSSSAVTMPFYPFYFGWVWSCWNCGETVCFVALTTWKDALSGTTKLTIQPKKFNKYYTPLEHPSSGWTPPTVHQIFHSDIHVNYSC